MKRSGHTFRTLQQELADHAAIVGLDSYGHPLGDGWAEMEWDYLEQIYPGKQETAQLRKCWTYAVARDLIEVRKRYQFRLRAQ